MITLQDLKFISIDQSDYIRRLEREYEKQQKEIEQLKLIPKDELWKRLNNKD